MEDEHHHHRGAEIVGEGRPSRRPDPLAQPAGRRRCPGHQQRGEAQHHPQARQHAQPEKARQPGVVAEVVGPNHQPDRQMRQPPRHQPDPAPTHQLAALESAAEEPEPVERHPDQHQRQRLPAEQQRAHQRFAPLFGQAMSHQRHVIARGNRGIGHVAAGERRLGLGDHVGAFGQHVGRAFAERRVDDQPRHHQPGVEQHAQHVAAQPDPQLGLGRPPEAGQRHQPEQGVVEQDVARPDEEEVDHAEQAEDHQPPGLKRAGRALGPGLLHEEVHPGPEQQREQAAHLAIDQDELRDPHPPARIARIGLEGCRVGIGVHRLAEGDDIGGKDAHHGKAADEIKRVDPLGCGHRRDRRRCFGGIVLRITRVHCVIHG